MQNQDMIAADKTASVKDRRLNFWLTVLVILMLLVVVVGIVMQKRQDAEVKAYCQAYARTENRHTLEFAEYLKHFQGFDPRIPRPVRVSLSLDMPADRRTTTRDKEGVALLAVTGTGDRVYMVRLPLRRIDWRVGANRVSTVQFHTRTITAYRLPDQPDTDPFTADLSRVHDVALCDNVVPQADNLELAEGDMVEWAGQNVAGALESQKAVLSATVRLTQADFDRLVPASRPLPT